MEQPVVTKLEISNISSVHIEWAHVLDNFTEDFLFIQSLPAMGENKKTAVRHRSWFFGRQDPGTFWIKKVL